MLIVYGTFIAKKMRNNYKYTYVARAVIYIILQEE